MEFCDATLDDAKLISEFVSSLTSEFIAPSLTDAGTMRLLAGMNLESTKQRIADGWLHVCCKEQDQLCGIVVVRPPVHLYHLFVRANRQRVGIGKSLFEIADRRTVASTGGQISTVNSSPNAIAAYRKMGFVLDGPAQDQGGIRFQPMVRDI